MTDLQPQFELSKIRQTMNTFALVDLALIDGTADVSPCADGIFPSWIAPVYREDAYSVTPILIDVLGACDAGELDSMMRLTNACKPPLHVSFIDTELRMEELAQHLRQFIYIVTEEGTELTLRFADCVVLPALADDLSQAQWATMAAPISRWLVHGRDGGLGSLPAAVPEYQPVAAPFVLTDEQVGGIKDAMGTERLLANLRNMRPGEPLGRTPEEAYRWACKAREMWHAASRTDDVLLLVFARNVFDTKGRILNLPSLPETLANPDAEALRRELYKLVEINSYESHE